MADILDAAKRSALMSGIRSTGNRETELRLINIFRASSITGWRRKQHLFGRPDFVFHREHVVVFVDGCFWHGCSTHGVWPATNRLFWRKKLEGNIARDRLVNLRLKRSGWLVIRIWQHELTKKNEPHLVDHLRKLLATKNNFAH